MFRTILITVATFFICLGFTSCEKAGLAGDSGSSSITTDLGGGGAAGNGNNNTPQPGVLTAGEWNDFDNWNFWTGLMANDTFRLQQAHWGFYPNQRWVFTVKDATGATLPDAVISISSGTNSLWEGRTNRFGKLNIVPGIFNASLPGNMQYTVKFNNQSYQSGPLNAAVPDINVSLPITANAATNVDLMFVVDATGSMSDEINYLKVELLDVLNRADNQLPGTLRYASVFYRDFGDAYVTRDLGFTSNKTAIVDFVKAQSADGGGDYPEAVEEALKKAMQQNWSTSARARILFLILDAPVHDDAQKLGLLRQQVELAAAKGVMIIPVAASGVDKPSEFLFRFMELSTNATYTFLTNDSGIGNSHITPTVGTYQVEFLNNLLVRLIAKYGGN